ncbi:MAG: Transcriptional regulator of heat shock protein [Candidatus Uhrbacteria bacterium GW2011_GWF2_41_16]|jgi:heat-inducible transcriptional repressor|uniref:Transcriptional regulator of heat shock protein n=2 Tax=Candidatus Uhriibacteriota TaxID=1752732 RepID=A0A0G0VBC0_9BACT|nr:MAG: Transcriptional regulator of heat shock protein [Candidatus Uhrbacteria bacterium GW2011_GWA2_41_10]KKR86643.1 MAG: Transcriptional regulator of heat shock protein [Candidatus Uhrbacteria bacterium GW2011_GWC2_41_11]KKR98213.1 MAG: Transcriptional regulator of heat shock protein [Candidatus Uhrbacteria bacterium GW2011_GWF2_41_16]
MEARQEQILRWIVEEYIRTAEPVGSKFLAVKYCLDVSSATVRNDMVLLEDEGYIRSPHPSAGRIPTEKGYEYYLRHFMEDKRTVEETGRLSAAIKNASSDETALKTLAKTLVILSGETAIVAFGPDWSYYTGVSNLFQKPDFQDTENVQNISELVDRFDDVVCQIFHAVSIQEPKVFLGQENPFGQDIAAVIIKYRLSNHVYGLIGLVGPMRMNYAKNMALVQEAREAIDRMVA